MEYSACSLACYTDKDTPPSAEADTTRALHLRVLELQEAELCCNMECPFIDNPSCDRGLFPASYYCVHCAYYVFCDGCMQLMGNGVCTAAAMLSWWYDI